MDKSIISWHIFHIPFQVLINLEDNNVGSSISRSNQHLPDSSQLPQTLTQAREACESQVGAFLTRQAHPLCCLLCPSTSSSPGSQSHLPHETLSTTQWTAAPTALADRPVFVYHFIMASLLELREVCQHHPLKHTSSSHTCHVNERKTPSVSCSLILTSELQKVMKPP